MDRGQGRTGRRRVLHRACRTIGRMPRMSCGRLVMSDVVRAERVKLTIWAGDDHVYLAGIEVVQGDVGAGSGGLDVSEVVTESQNRN